MDGAIASGWTLVHNVTSDDAMKCQYIIVAEETLRSVLFHEAQSGQIVDDLAPGAGRDGREFTAFLNRAHLLECERIAFNGRGGMGVAGAGVLLQGRNPLHLNCGG